MRDAVVHTDERHVEGEGERAGCRGDRPEARPESRALGERDDIDVREVDARHVRGLPDQGDDPFRVVVRGLPGVDPSVLGTEHLVDVCEDLRVPVDDPHADGVRRAFDPEGEHARTIAGRE